MPLIYDHRDPANVRQYSAEAGQCVGNIPGLSSVPVDSPPVELGIYPAGADVEPLIQPGEKVVSRERVIQGGKSVLVVTKAAMTTAEVEAAAAVAEAAAVEAEEQKPTTMEEHEKTLARIADLETWQALAQGLIAELCAKAGIEVKQ